MIPIQRPKTYLDGIQATDANISSLIGAVRWPYQAFWADPLNQVDALEAEAAACGMTAAGVFQSHLATITYLGTVAPDRMDWFAMPPIEAPFNQDGSVDRELLATRWAAYQATLPQPEPEEN